MTTCAHCVNWSLTDKTPRNFARTGTASCSLGPSWTYLHASKTCPKFAPATDATVEKRRQIVREKRKADEQ